MFNKKRPFIFVWSFLFTFVKNIFYDTAHLDK